MLPEVASTFLSLLARLLSSSQHYASRQPAPCPKLGLPPTTSTSAFVSHTFFLSARGSCEMYYLVQPSLALVGFVLAQPPEKPPRGSAH
jgi:hypothetical protein